MSPQNAKYASASAHTSAAVSTSGQIKPLDANALALARQVLGRGGLIALPTETVYGLGADASQPKAVAKIFAAKGRPHFNPLIAHFADVEQAQRQVVFGDTAHALAKAFWPGPLTLVLPLRAETTIAPLANDAGTTQAVRVPRVPPALSDLLSHFPAGLVAPSANPSGRLSPTTAKHVAHGLGTRVDLILDGGSCGVGVESTILDLTTQRPTLLRQGGVPQEAIQAVLGALPLGHDTTPERVKAPGQLASHYAPNARVCTNRVWQQPPPQEGGIVTLGFGAQEGLLNLSPASDLIEAASNLFAHLARLDSQDGVQEIWVAPIPDTGIGRAINDRLNRAAVSL